MTAYDFLQIGLYLLILLLLIKPMGSYMTHVFADQPNRLTRLGAGVERLVYRACGVDAKDDMNWKRYAIAMLVFNVCGMLLVYALQRMQQWLPLNPEHFPAVS